MNSYPLRSRQAKIQCRENRPACRQSDSVTGFLCLTRAHLEPRRYQPLKASKKSTPDGRQVRTDSDTKRQRDIRPILCLQESTLLLQESSRSHTPLVTPGILLFAEVL